MVVNVKMNGIKEGITGEIVRNIEKNHAKLIKMYCKFATSIL